MVDDGERPAWVRLLEELEVVQTRLDEVEYLAVTAVREAGATWEDIGEHFGISRQAARERYGQPRRRQPGQPRRRG